MQRFNGVVYGIVAVNNGGWIGLNGGLPWRCKADLRFFRERTVGNVCICGSRTYESVKRLDNRIINTIGKEFYSADAAWERSVSDANERDCDIYVIGGNITYTTYFSRIDKWLISHINNNTVGDTALHVLEQIYMNGNYEKNIFDER